MGQVNGSYLIAEGLKEEGIDTIFYLMGGPNILLSMHAKELGIRLIDVRHEQAAAMMAHAYSRATGKVGVCMGAAGPGTTNLLTGVANAYLDACPVLALGGASPIDLYELGDFQEMDQLSMYKPITKWAARLYEARRAKEYVHNAVLRARRGQPGPVYLDMPGDILVENVDQERVCPRPALGQISQPTVDTKSVERAIEILRGARKPVLVSGSGVFWSGAGAAMQAFVETTGIPFFTTPQGRGVVPDDHRLSFLGARSLAFSEADVVLVVGTRFNFIIGHGRSPRFSPNAKFIQVDVDSEEISRTRSIELGLVGDAKAVLGQLTEVARGRVSLREDDPWIRQLAAKDSANREKMVPLLNSDARPIHPMRLCKEVGDFLGGDGILVEDGHEILNMSRQTISSRLPGQRINPGPNGCMGVGVPFGVGAKAARPEKRVVVLTGDGSLGMNIMELDTAVRRGLPILVVVSNNAGWTATAEDMSVPGQVLGHVRYDIVAQGLGAHGELVEDPRGLRPALERAARELDQGRSVLLNVITDPTARAQMKPFVSYGGETYGTSLM